MYRLIDGPPSILHFELTLLCNQSPKKKYASRNMSGCRLDRIMSFSSEAFATLGRRLRRVDAILQGLPGLSIWIPSLLIVPKQRRVRVPHPCRGREALSALLARDQPAADAIHPHLTDSELIDIHLACSRSEWSIGQELAHQTLTQWRHLGDSGTPRGLGLNARPFGLHVLQGAADLDAGAPTEGHETRGHWLPPR